MSSPCSLLASGTVPASCRPALPYQAGSCFGKTEDRTESSVAFLLLYLTVIYYGIPRCIIVYYVVHYIVYYIVY